MRKLQCLFFCCTAVAILLSSCSKRSSDHTTPPDKTNKIGIEKVSAIIKNIDLSGRGQWQIFVGSAPYIPLLNGNEFLTASPEKDLYYLRYEGKISDVPTSSFYVYFSSTKYASQFGPVFKESSPTYYPPNIFNQSSVHDLINADLLIGQFKGIITPQVSGIQLTHANALFDFIVTGLDPAATLSINDLKLSFLPYQEQPGHYKAIVTGKWIGIDKGTGYNLPPVMIEVSKSGNKFSSPLPSEFYPVKSNAKYTFRINVNHINNSITITDLTTAIWDDELFSPF